MTKSTNNIISFSDAYQFLRKFRYKPRNEWSKDERAFFKICNFIILSKKRVNKIISSLNSFYKLSDKSHYSFTKEDILAVKEIILENMENGLQKFEKEIKIIKESDIVKLKEHFDKLKEDNLRLNNENERLQNIIENYINERKLYEIGELEDILSKEKVSQKRKLKRLKNFKENKLKEFVKDWKSGEVSINIRDSILSDKKLPKKKKKINK